MGLPSRIVARKRQGTSAEIAALVPPEIAEEFLVEFVDFVPEVARVCVEERLGGGSKPGQCGGVVTCILESARLPRESRREGLPEAQEAP